MAGVIDDEGGQWIALSGLSISLSLVLVAALINQAAVTGYYSSYASFDFPAERIREIAAQTQESAKSAAQLAWALNHTSNETVLFNFTKLLSSYSSQLNMIYAVHGATVNITMFNYDKNNDTYTYTSGNISLFNSTNHSMNIIWLNISYNDGTTRYASEPEIIEME